MYFCLRDKSFLDIEVILKSKESLWIFIPQRIFHVLEIYLVLMFLLYIFEWVLLFR
jgi:hypothetical protein